MRTKVGDQNAVGINRIKIYEPMTRRIVAGKDGIEVKFQDRLWFGDRTEVLGKILEAKSFLC